MGYRVKLSVFLDCDKDTGYRMRDLIDNLLEKNVDGDLVKHAKTIIQYSEGGL